MNCGKMDASTPRPTRSCCTRSEALTSTAENQVVSKPPPPVTLPQCGGGAWRRSQSTLQLAAALVSLESPAVAVFPPFTPHSGRTLLGPVSHSSSQPSQSVCLRSSPDFHALFLPLSLFSNPTAVCSNRPSRVQDGGRSFQYSCSPSACAKNTA